MGAGIKRRAVEAQRRLNEHDAKRIVLVAELAAIRAECPHLHVREWSRRDYGGGTDHHWVCDDCGLQKVT